MYPEGSQSTRTVYSTHTDETEARLLPASSPATPYLGTPRSSMAVTAPFMHGPAASSSMASFTDDLPASKQATLNKYALPADPRAWASFAGPEPDDYLHDPERNANDNGDFISWRGLANVGCITLLVVGILTLFAGYPIISHYVDNDDHVLTSSANSLNLVTNTSGQIPSMKGKWKMIDDDTPPDAYTLDSYTESGKQLQLVFSDEFNSDGRSFYPGDDPFWEALDLHYWQTVDLEWYDPAAITTVDGALEITFESKLTHELNYQGGMMTTWNNFCFTGGIVQAAVMLPGSPDITGYWPAVWTMGNLGRVGYGATTDGMWPYTYDSCDYGTVKNQTIGDQPAGALVPGLGDKYNGDAFSYLPGQRLSRCTCSGDHPGPKHSDGSYVGRSAPEIDLFEATAGANGGNVSQSLQAAPFNQGYYFWNTTDVPDAYKVYDDSITTVNSYHGGAYQEAISALSINNQTCYELSDKCFAEYAIEYVPGTDDGSYVTWVGNGKPTWTLTSKALAADPRVSIGAKPVPTEPMYLIMNLGMSPSFQEPSADLPIPGKMRVDWIRVYQDPDNLNTGCDPKDRPTMDYIERYKEAYTNPNHTLWSDIGETFPGNSFAGDC